MRLGRTTCMKIGGHRTVGTVTAHVCERQRRGDLWNIFIMESRTPRWRERRTSSPPQLGHRILPLEPIDTSVTLEPSLSKLNREKNFKMSKTIPSFSRLVLAL